MLGAVISICLLGYFFQLREEPVHCDASKKVIICWGGERGSVLFPLEYLGKPPDTYLLKGIYTRVGVPIPVAYFMGLYLPACVVISMVILIVVIRRRWNRRGGQTGGAYD